MLMSLMRGEGLEGEGGGGPRHMKGGKKSRLDCDETFFFLFSFSSALSAVLLTLALLQKGKRQQQKWKGRLMIKKVKYEQ